MDKLNSNEVVFATPITKTRVPVCDKSIVTELSDDFTLPDYRAEIRRLLRISATLPAPSAYTGGGNAEFSGDVVYKILYVGGDSKLHSADLVALYEVSAELEGEEREGLAATDEIEIESIVGRVSAPRKLSIRCRLRHRITARADRELNLPLDGEGIVKLHEVCPCAVSVSAEDDSHEIEEMIGGLIDPRIIFADATVLMSHASPRDGGIHCSGSVLLCVLSESEEGQLRKTDRKLPFEAVIPADVEGDGWECRAYGCVPELRTEMGANGLQCRMRLSLFADAQKNLPVRIIGDIYSTEAACEVETEELPVSEAKYCGIGNFTVSGTSEPSGLPENYRIVYATATAEPEELMVENEKYVLTGRCRFSAVMDGDEYSCREFELPFRYEFGSSDSDEIGDYSVRMFCHSVRVRGEGKTLSADAELSMAIRVQGKRNVRAVTSAELGAPIGDGRPLYTVVYVPKGESLWSISKKYLVDPSSVAQANGLRCASPAASDSLGGANFLII